MAGLNAEAPPEDFGAGASGTGSGAGTAGAASSCWIRASTRAPYSVFNACSSARSALTSSAASATTGIKASASSAAMGLELNMDFLLPKLTNTRREPPGVGLLVNQEGMGGARERNAEKARCGTW